MTTTPRGGGERHTKTFAHLDDRGQARMVDVTAKPFTRRTAVARCVIVTVADAPGVLAHPWQGVDHVEAARFAGIQAAKRTASLIPLCHPLCLDRVSVEVETTAHRVEVSASTEIVERTGVEMEALTACAVAALTLLKALFALDPEASIEELTLWRKSGGRSGDWVRTGPESRLTRRSVASAEPPAPNLPP